MSVRRHDAIVVAVREHGEHGVIVRFLTRDGGLVAGYVRGGKSRHMRPALVPGNRVLVELRARTEDQLAGATVDLLDSRAGALGEPIAALGVQWVTALVATLLPEDQPYPAIHDGLDALLATMAASPGALRWAGALARVELGLLAALGYGLDLDRCAVTGEVGTTTYVSPRTGAAVSAGSAAGHERQLLALPPFLRDGGAVPDGDAALAALRLSGHFVARLLDDMGRARVLVTRTLLVDRLHRAVA